tara:strand:+ start:9606 stop:10178 length:573 start_codon:yes stop_codon:yes gene_type:complete
MWKHNGRTITVGKAWTADNGVQNPANWHIWSASEKVAAGVVEIVEETPPDSRLYNWSMGSDGKITKTAKSLTDVNEVDGNGDPLLDEEGKQVVTRGVKWNLKQEVKSQQGSLLSQTDWVIIRKADKGTAIPSNIQTWRDGIRTKATQMETAIDNAADTDAIAALFVTYTSNADGSQTKSGILYDWPELGD